MPIGTNVVPPCTVCVLFCAILVSWRWPAKHCCRSTAFIACGYRETDEVSAESKIDPMARKRRRKRLTFSAGVRFLAARARAWSERSSLLRDAASPRSSCVRSERSLASASSCCSWRLASCSSMSAICLRMLVRSEVLIVRSEPGAQCINLRCVTSPQIYLGLGFLISDGISAVLGPANSRGIVVREVPGQHLSLMEQSGHDNGVRIVDVERNQMAGLSHRWLPESFRLHFR